MSSSTVQGSLADALNGLSCPAKLDKLRASLINLYEALSGVVVKGRFRGFMNPGDLDEKFQMRPEVYPRLTMRFTDSEQEALAAYTQMDSESLLAQARTPLERLLMAAIWKNGDLAKVRHIAAGLAEGPALLEMREVDAEAPVFTQFGRHLADPARQPIADQHTLRAYRLFTKCDPCDKRHFAGTVNGVEVREYVEWVRQMAEACGDDDPAGEAAAARMRDFDRSMFALGKATKVFLKAVVEKSDRV